MVIGKRAESNKYSVEVIEANVIVDKLAIISMGTF